MQAGVRRRVRRGEAAGAQAVGGCARARGEDARAGRDGRRGLEDDLQGARAVERRAQVEFD